MTLKSLGSVSERASRLLTGIGLAFVLTVAVCIAPAGAVNKIEPVSVAVVDAQLIMRQSDAAKMIREQVEARRKIYEKEYQQREAEVREAEKALPQQRAILANDVFQARLREHQEKVASLQRDGQSMKRQLDQAFGRANGKVREAMIDIVAEVAKEANVGLVLFKNQIFLGDRKIDLTEEVMVRLNKRLPKVDVTFSEAAN
ncbi:MAG: OmpH family outer membrane protein [Nisaea sp.]|uniref:OmpH family outer membrane protein n=1 Tax=Nisaea sp. TaxID=2024842 RepID=UPI001B25BCF1|nr:OmpH family outer membrane protein [Nisaea sp.]MBO6559218.1 OmpH family outer membrane protein [Nisaea sp.]